MHSFMFMQKFKTKKTLDNKTFRKGIQKYKKAAGKTAFQQGIQKYKKYKEKSNVLNYAMQKMIDLAAENKEKQKAVQSLDKAQLLAENEIPFNIYQPQIQANEGQLIKQYPYNPGEKQFKEVITIAFKYQRLRRYYSVASANMVTNPGTWILGLTDTTDHLASWSLQRIDIGHILLINSQWAQYKNLYKKFTINKIKFDITMNPLCAGTYLNDGWDYLYNGIMNPQPICVIYQLKEQIDNTGVYLMPTNYGDMVQTNNYLLVSQKGETKCKSFEIDEKASQEFKETSISSTFGNNHFGWFDIGQDRLFAEYNPTSQQDVDMALCVLHYNITFSDRV